MGKMSSSSAASAARVRQVVPLALALLAVVAGAAPFVEPARAQSTAPGGFVESMETLEARPLLSPSEIDAFMPQRGPFTFPAPYGTQGYRLTNASDCGGADCVRPVGYSYWRNINNHAGSSTLLAFLGLDQSKGGSGPTLFSIDKVTGETRNLGPLFDAGTSYASASGEGWYFSATRPHALYVNSGSRLLRYDVLARTFEQVFDVAAQFGTDKYIWQAHSSNDDLVHSFTLRQSGTWATLGCGVYKEATQQYAYFVARGDFDECQIDKSGRYLLIKENIDGLAGEDNIIEDLETGMERVYYDQQGAGGHSDNGYGYAVAEDNWASVPGAVRVFRFDQEQGDASNGNGTLVFRTTSWSVSAGHIAHANAVPGTPISEQFACSATATREILPRANEVLCYRLDGSLQTLVVAPVLTDLDASGGGSGDYWKQPKGNLDPSGEYFIWTSNLGGSRLDAIVVRIPTQQIPGGQTQTTTEPAPEPEPDPDPDVSTSSTSEAVAWTDLVATSVIGTTLTKTSGCDGCGGGAISSQQIASGDGYVEFTALETDLLRAVGLSNGNPGTSIGEITFAIRLQSGWAEVRESGVYEIDTAFVSGDVFRVAIADGLVQYSKNGEVFYTSTTAPTYPLLVDVSLPQLNGTVANAVIALASVDTSPEPEPAPDEPDEPLSDTTPPTVQVTAPASGATVSGVVTISAVASDDVQVADVQFTLDGAPLGNALSAVPYDLTWDTTSSADGVHTLLAAARDWAGNVATATAEVIVANSPALVLSDVRVTSVKTTSAVVRWTTNLPANSLVEYGTSLAYGSSTGAITASVTTHAVTLSGLSPGTAYHFRAVSQTANDSATSNDLTFRTKGGGKR